MLMNVALLAAGILFLGAAGQSAWTKYLTVVTKEQPALVVGANLPTIKLKSVLADSLVQSDNIWPRVGCSITLFFNPDCPVCERLAPDWRGRDSATLEGRTLPVQWLGINASDSAALSFYNRHGLGGPLYNLVKPPDWSKWRIYGVPMFYVMDASHSLVGRGDYYTADSMRVRSDDPVSEKCLASQERTKEAS
jgi:hypothetical protein